MKTIKNLSFKSMAVFSTLLIFSACNEIDLNGKTPALKKDFIVNQPCVLDVETSGGWIKVEGQSGDKAEIQVFVEKNGSALSEDDKLVQDLMDGFDLLIEQQGNAITAYSKRTNNIMPWKNISVSFYIIIPEQTSCDIKTSGGSIEVNNVEGKHQIHTSGGGIKLADIKGKTTANTSGGSIHATNLEGNTDISTSGGRIEIDNCNGDIMAHTSGGGIRLDNINGKIDASTSGGGIKITGNAGDVRAKTSGGSIDADIKGLDKALYLETSGGSINATIPGNLGMDLNLEANKVNIDLQSFSGSAKRNKINGSVNGGGIDVYMHTSGGGITVNYQ